MKSLSKKFMLSIVAIALVVIALGTSTFAWFTLSNKASVGQFNAEVTAGEGMELSLDGNNWYSTIPADVIQQKIADSFTAGTLNNETIGEPILTAVTTTDLVEYKYFNSTTREWGNAVANKDYIKLNIQVRAVGLVKVSINVITVTGTSKTWNSDVAFAGAKGPVSQGGAVTVDAAYGARIGINPLTNLISSEGNTPFADKFVFENADSPTNTVLGGTALPTSTNGQAAYYLAKSGINPNITGTTPPTAVIESQQTVDATVGEQVLSLLVGTPYNTGNFDLLVWFEGFDPDTYDSILKMPLNIKMSFIGAE